MANQYLIQGDPGAPDLVQLLPRIRWTTLKNFSLIGAVVPKILSLKLLCGLIVPK